MAPKLYIFKASPVCTASLITAKYLGIELEVHTLDFIKQEHLSPAYLKLNPQHTCPTLDDNGIVIWESHAINTYLVRKYGKDDSLYPKDFYKRAVVDQRLHFESGVLFPLLRLVDFAYFKKEIKEVPARWAQEIHDGYAFLEKFLEGHPWAAGDSVTLADIQLLPTVSCLDYHVKIDQKAYPKITGWIKRTQELPFFSCNKDAMQCFTDLFYQIKGT